MADRQSEERPFARNALQEEAAPINEPQTVPDSSIEVGDDVRLLSILYLKIETDF